MMQSNISEEILIMSCHVMLPNTVFLHWRIQGFFVWTLSMHAFVKWKTPLQ